MKTKILFLALFFSSLSFGQLLQWNTFGNTGTETSEPSIFNNPDISSSNLTLGIGVTGAGNANRFGGSAWFDTGDTNPTTLNESILGNDYIQFSVTPNPGFSFTATSFVFNWDRSGTGPANVSLRSSIDGYTSDLGTIIPVAAFGTSNTITISGLSNVSTTVTFRLYGYAATAAGGTGGFDVTPNVINVQLNGTTASTCASPTTQATAFTSSSITPATATVGWTRGNGNNVLVVARAGSAVTADPASGTSYIANAAFGSGTQIGVGNYVVYNGPLTSVNLTGLTSGTTYHFALYEYNTTATCYNTVELTGNFTTTVAPPVMVLSDNGTQVVAANVPQATTNHILSTFKVDVTANTTTLTNVTVVSGGNYQAADISANGFKLWFSTANLFSGATAIGTALSATATGTGESLNFGVLTQNLVVGTGYFWITANISPTATVGRTIRINAVGNASLTFSAGTKSGATTLPGLQTITASAPNVPTAFTKVCTTNTTQSLSWSPPATGAFDGYLLVVREANTPHAVTAIVGNSTTQNLNYSLAPQFGSTAVLSRILYSGTATTATVSGLTPGVSYTFQLYAYKNNGASSIYSATGTTTTQVMGLSNVTSASASPANTSASLSWANPNAACYDQILVVATAAPGITFAPSGDGTAYSPNTVFSGFNQVVYASSGNLVTVTGLTNGVTYYFELFVRNGTQWSSGVEISVKPINIVPTVLKTGDLLLIAYDNTFGASADDAIRLVTFVDITAGTKFLWSNATYETGGNPAANVRTDKWFSCISPSPTGNVPFLEITYDPASPTSIIPAGSIFCLRTVVSGTASTISAVSSAGVVSPNSDFDIIGKNADGTLLLSHNSVNVSTSSPDAMFLLQGDFIYNATGSTFNGTVLSAVQDGATWFDLSTDLTTATGDALRTSRKHPQLLCASIQGNLTAASYEVSYNVGTTFYTNDNKPNLIGKILDYTANWSFTFGSCPAISPFVITASDPFNRWTGSANANWFDCNNWALLSVPDELTDVTISSPVPNSPTISYLAPISDSYSDIAKCKNLTISGSVLRIEGTATNPTGAPFNSRLEINENLIINGTGILDMDDSNAATADGELSLIGNWTNSLGTASFLEGNGTVKFIGSTTQVINNNVHTATEEFYNVVLANDFNTSTSNNLIATGNLEINLNKNVTVASNEYIQASKNLKNDGSLTINDSGMLYQTDDLGVDTGSITMQRNASIRTQDYVYWSSPVEDFNTSNIYGLNTPTNLIFKWNPQYSLNPNGGEGYWINAAGDTMLRGIGYIVRGPSGLGNGAPQSVQAIFNTGKPNNGVVPVTISRGNMVAANLASYTSANAIPFTVNDDNWNLVGNPYPSAINANTFLQYNAVTVPNIEGAIRIWTHGTLPTNTVNPFYASYAYNYTSSDYITYNGTATTSGPAGFNGFIGAAQGFFVLMNDGASASATLTFNNSMRVKSINSNSQFYKTANVTTGGDLSDKSRIWLDLISANGTVERTVVGYVPNATLAKDVMYDAYTRLDNNQRFYSLIDDEIMCIQGRPLPFDQNDQVPLGLKLSDNSSTYTIAIAEADGLFDENQSIFLEDKTLNTIHDLRQSPYLFTAVNGIYNERFVLRYTNATLGSQDVETADTNVVVATPNNQVKIKSNSDKITSVVIFDILGREIAKKEKVSESEVIFDNVTARNQALIVKIKLENDQIITRKIIL